MAYTIEQWEQRIKEAGDGRYEFLGWVNNQEYGWNKWLVCTPELLEELRKLGD